MKFYHATTTENMEKIAATGIIRKSWDGVVYLCTENKIFPLLYKIIKLS